MAIPRDTEGTLVERPDRRLEINLDGRVLIGRLQGSGAFDAAAADPLELWTGRLTAAGGRAHREVSSTAGCVQAYEVVIAFR
jgi:hypothetical protein